MGRVTKPLNVSQIEASKPRAKEYNLADGQGLLLRVKPNGSKLWLFNYSHPVTKKRTNISLGSFPSLSLASARSKRAEYLTLLAEGNDPKSIRDESALEKHEDSKNSFRIATEAWLNFYSVNIKEGTLKQIKNSFDNDVLPYIGHIALKELSFQRVKIDVISRIIARGKYETARKVARRINHVMVHAKINGWIETNPLDDLTKLIPASKVKNLPALSPNELPELMEKVAFADIKFVTQCLIEWQLHTMVRPGEAVLARWDDISFEAKEWTIPAVNMKMGKSHTVPLTPQAVCILEAMRSHTGNREFVFAGDKDPNKSMNKETVNRALKRMGFAGRTVAHGFRSLASTILNEEGFDYDVIESALAHQDSNKVRAAYNRATYLERRREMMGWWSSHIERASAMSLTARLMKVEWF